MKTTKEIVGSTASIQAPGTRCIFTIHETVKMCFDIWDAYKIEDNGLFFVDRGFAILWYSCRVQMSSFETNGFITKKKGTRGEGEGVCQRGSYKFQYEGCNHPSSREEDWQTCFSSLEYRSSLCLALSHLYLSAYSYIYRHALEILSVPACQDPYLRISGGWRPSIMQRCR